MKFTHSVEQFYYFFCTHCLRKQNKTSNTKRQQHRAEAEQRQSRWQQNKRKRTEIVCAFACFNQRRVQNLNHTPSNCAVHGCEAKRGEVCVCVCVMTSFGFTPSFSINGKTARARSFSRISTRHTPHTTPHVRKAHYTKSVTLAQISTNAAYV